MMEHTEKLLIIDLPSLGKAMNIVSHMREADIPIVEYCSVKVIEGFEMLIGVYLNFYDYDEDLDDLVSKIEEMNLLETLMNIVSLIEQKSKEAWSGFSDVKIFTPRGLIGLIFLNPN